MGATPGNSGAAPSPVLRFRCTRLALEPPVETSHLKHDLTRPNGIDNNIINTDNKIITTIKDLLTEFIIIKNIYIHQLITFIIIIIIYLTF